MRATLLERINPGSGAVYLPELGLDDATLRRITRVVFLGCGSSWHAGLVSRHLIEDLAHLRVAADMKYNPIALIHRRMLAVALAPSGRTRDAMAANIPEVRARDGLVIALATRGDDGISELADEVIPLLPGPGWIQPILAAIPLQLVAYYVAARAGRDIDQPRNLAKCATVE